MSEKYKYPGDELSLFQNATHWKTYFSRIIRPYLKGTVLEAGAGIGGTTTLLNDGSSSKWVLMEPDAGLSKILQQKIESKDLPSNTSLQTGTIDDIAGKYDTILYIDVMEHIEADKIEMHKAASRLNEGGHIVILSPAFPLLYSPFDKAIGHYRRYTRETISRISPDGLQLVHNRYYDSVGFFASLMNKLIFRQHYPTLSQVMFWDKWMIPVSTIMDKIILHSFGKSIISVWEKTVPDDKNANALKQSGS